jgi:hypothetical protein
MPRETTTGADTATATAGSDTAPAHVESGTGASEPGADALAGMTQEEAEARAEFMEGLYGLDVALREAGGVSLADVLRKTAGNTFGVHL